MKYHVVTTMNEAGWIETGKKMVDTFLKHWEVPLTIYAEGFDPSGDYPELPIHIRTLPSWVDNFKFKHHTVNQYNGRIGAGYDYRYDAVKFAHKVGALTDFGEEIDDGVVIWLDADTITHEDVNPEWLEHLFPEPAYLAWLDRLNAHPECGFVMFRASHPYHKSFMQSFRNIYITGDIFRQREYHDSYILQQLVASKVASGKIPPPASLSGDITWHHPFVNGPLGAKLDHLKGPRKSEGKSRVRDMRKPRTEQYWKDR